MAHLIAPLLEQGFFSSVNLDRNRLYSQIIDNLNKAAVVGFPLEEIGSRLVNGWQGDPAQLRVYDDVQTCASLYRKYCLENNLLDFSLQVEVFHRHVWNHPVCREYILSLYSYLIADNLEEDNPLSHDILAEWLPEFTSALLIYDLEGGNRIFLGADPQSAYQLKQLCSQTASFDQNLVTSPDLRTFGGALTRAIYEPGRLDLFSPSPDPAGAVFLPEELASIRTALVPGQSRFFPQMLDWVAERIEFEIQEEQVPPGEIAVLSPFLSDSLRHALSERLRERGIPSRSHRPSRSLRDEPAAGCLLTLAALAHPDWGFLPTRFDVAYALMLSIQDLDLVRAQLLAEITYRTPRGVPQLGSFDGIRPEMQARITYSLGERFQALSDWLAHYRAGLSDELDIFFSRLFGEILSQPGFGFHASYDAARVAANLIESVQKFRWVAADILAAEEIPLGKEYLGMVKAGVIAAQYLYNWQTSQEDAVLLAPAYTFLLSNRPVQVQFWLDVGSRGWGERLYQPLTNPYVLTREWPAGHTWSDQDEVETNRRILEHLAVGLLRRCRGKVYLGLSELNEAGYEQRGPLLQAIQRVLRQVPVI